MAALFGCPLQAGQHQTPIVLESTTSVERPPNPIIEFVTGTPVDLMAELIPAGGTLRLRFDGDLTATWNDDDVYPNNTFDLYVSLGSDSLIVGEVVLEYVYLLRPSYRIDWDSLFHDPIKNWGKQDPSLLDFPDTGVVEQRFPLVNRVPEVRIRRKIDITPDDSLFLLGNTLSSAADWEDTLHLSFDHSPFPCVQLHAAATIRTSLSFDIQTNMFCIRLAPRADTLCWEALTGLYCQWERTPPWHFTYDVPCEAVEDLVVALCPIKAQGWAGVSIAAEAVLDTLELVYGGGCTSTTTPTSADPDTIVNSWLYQDVFFGTDRDDAIFTVPVALDNVDLELLEAPYDTVQALEPVYRYNEYRIAWAAPDDALEACCPDYSALVAFRDTTLGTVCCSDLIVDGLPSDSLGFNWTVPDTLCLPDDTVFRLFVDFYCTHTDSILYRAWSELFIYRD